MTTETMENRSLDDWVTEDEIDLRKYLETLLRWWREIIAITVGVVLFAILAITIMRIALPLQYITSSDVAIVRTISDVNFDERFRTSEEELGTDTGSRSARRSALLGLVTTGAIAQRVIADIGDTLDESEQNPANLLQMVDAEAVLQAGSRTDSDLIRILVTADDPEKAAGIANSWARNYVSEINAIYSEVPDEILTSIQAELAEAEQSYLTAQTNLETFIANNRIDELTALLTVLQQQVSQEVSLQQALLRQWQTVQEALNTAEMLHAQIETGGDGAVRSAMPALQVLKIGLYGRASEQLQVEMRDFPEITADAMLQDITGIVTSLQNQLQVLETQIDTNNEQLRPTADNTDPIHAVLQELSDTKALLEAEQARQRQLNQQRDLNWETFRTLSNKVAELNLTRAAASSEVRFGSEAIAPSEPTRRVSLSIGVLVAGFIGLFAALLIVIIAEIVDISPFLSRSDQQA